MLATLCVTMCASWVKIIFQRIYKLFGTYYCTAQVHCSMQPTSIGILKIDALQDVLFPWQDGRGPWRNPFKEKRLMRNERIKICSVRAPKIST